MKLLPVPPLPQTLAIYVETVAVLQTESEQAATRAAVEAFAADAGPHCQRELDGFAREANDAGSSWLWDAWLTGYHTTRPPLPLTSNVGFEIAMPAGAPGLRRAARVVRGFAAAYLAHLRGDAPPEVSPRGELLSMQQWLPVHGGVRDPRPDHDVFLPGSTDPAHREIVVLVCGRAVAVRVSDEAGRPVTVGCLERTLAQLLRHDDGTADGTADDAAGGLTALPFAAPSYLDCPTATRVLASMTARPGNAATYERLREALFVVRLVEGSGDSAEHLARAAWSACGTWAFKPITVEVGLADEFVGIHLEHSMLDGATVGAIIGRAQSEVRRDSVDPHREPAAAPADRQSLRWELTPPEEEEIRRGLTTYGDDAAHLRVRIVRAPLAALPELPFRFSHDAGCQLVLAFAQLRVYGRLRSTYESVDMSEYQGGRTECLRPNTPAKAACAAAMLAGTAGPEHLAAALEAHRAQVKRCKAGQGIDRHLFGLDLMARKLGLANPLTEDPGYRLLVNDFLSTTSLGNQDTIVRAAFAPTSPGGIGIYYSLVPGGYEWLLSHRAGDTESYDAFVENLRAGATAMQELFAAL